MQFRKSLKYIIFAILILIFGYLFGTIILIIIGVIIALMTIFFIVSMFFTKGLFLFANKNFRLFFYMLFSSFISLLVTFGFWNLINKIIDPFAKLVLVWVINTIIFGSLWNILTLSKKVKYKKNSITSKNIIEYSNTKKGIEFKDILFMVIIPSIITISINIIYQII